MPVPHNLPTDPGRRLTIAESRAGDMADALRDVLALDTQIDQHIDNCPTCRARREQECTTLQDLVQRHEQAKQDGADLLSRTTGVERDEDSFTIHHSGEWLNEVCPECMAVIAGQALCLLPEEQQKLLIAASPAGRKLVGIARRVTRLATRDGSVPGEVMQALCDAAAEFPSGREMRESTLARAVRRAAG